MDQNQTIDSDLQKAIDDITKTTSVDPVFSDPVAAPSSVPEGDTGELDAAVGPFPAPEPVMPEPMTMPEPVIPEPVASEPVVPELPEIPVAPELPATPVDEATVPENLNIEQVKEAALRDLAPILAKMHINPSQKFRIYRDIYETMNDYTVLEPAYEAAKGIGDENERGEALLYLVEAIDKM